MLKFKLRDFYYVGWGAGSVHFFSQCGTEAVADFSPNADEIINK